ncbi:zinc finger protein 225-like [Hylaeus volcanicus]|uniref:zinc finger protein 225-like n=1 Tax=Hylaeus volcanicus TaxID=313075 RepID=UPI0023B85ECA|nr:zinc finger protein 225-like [Hylaeus volcanicus]XP_053985173.1 zinc finger protein 225-like [Hylaeus volcanicus]
MSIDTNFQGTCKNDMVHMQSVNFVCPICDCRYENKKEIYDHLHIHAGDVLLKHIQCLKNDVNNESLTEIDNYNQERINDNFYENSIRPFKCHQCDLTFDRASQYDYHYRSIHLGEKSQLCEICGKGFFRKADLRTHLNTHLGTNICICEVCGRKFNHISNLIRHGRMHAGVKPYPCSICGKRFTQISSLARHKRIHERSKEDVKHQAQNICDGGMVEKKDYASNKNKFVDGNASIQQKVIKRQHYCKICGESFSFIFLLREHEKSHTGNAINLEYKNNEMSSQKITELEEYKSDINSFDFLENEENIKKILPLETIIYITSEQLKKINLENIEHTGNHISQDQLRETDGKIGTTDELNISEKLGLPNEQTECEDDSSILLYRSNDCEAKENMLYVCQVDDPVLKDRLDTKFSNTHDNFTQTYELDLEKSETLQSYNALTNISINVTDMFQKIDLSEPSINDKSDLDISSDEGINSARDEKIAECPNDVNNTTSHDEPMLRLVQTETGDQFYEFLINNLAEKLPNLQSVKASETKDENINISENVTNMCLNINKDVNEEVRDEQNIRDVIHNDLHYTHYELQGEEKNFVTNQILLDPQTDFDKYVETNFEVFERLHYDDSSERFLEFVEGAGVESESSKILDKESEQLLQFQSFSQIESMQENDKNDGISDNEQALLTSLTEDTQCEINTNSDRIVEEDEEQVQATDSMSSITKLEDQEDESKKSKVFLLKFQCTVCEKSFSTSYNYKQHIGTHFADQQKFHCKECKMSFAWKSTLNKHIASNHRPEGPQKFACDICQKIYNTSSQVNEHVKRDHLKQRNHVCSYCGKSFFKKYDLKIHNRIHTDERPYVCRACGKRFHHRSHIIRHERIHF